MINHTASQPLGSSELSEAVSGLRQARELRNWTLDVALRAFVMHSPEDASGLTAGLLSRWERGKSRTSKRYRRLCCEVYERTSDELFAHQDREPSRAEAPLGSMSAKTGWFRLDKAAAPLRISICGSRASGVDSTAVGEAISALSRFLVSRRCEVNHGPVGIGIEVMTYIANNYRPPDLQTTVAHFGRPNVVKNADLVLVVGGGQGTRVEVDLAIAMGKQIVPFPASGGAAAYAFARISEDADLRRDLPPGVIDTLAMCNAEGYAEVVEQAVLRRASA